MTHHLRLLFGAVLVLSGCGEDALHQDVAAEELGTAHSSLMATYDNSLGVPRCSSFSSYCGSGNLLNGRGTVGPESGAPNTIYSSCIDGNAGTYLVDESLQSLSVATLDGSTMAAGKQVRITASVFVKSAWYDGLSLFYAANASNPSWVYLTTLYASGTGVRSLSTTYTLPDGALQAIRGRFAYNNSTTSPCAGLSTSWTDHDDLAFAVAAAPTDTTPPTVALTVPTEGSVVPQAISLAANASDNVQVARVEFFGDGALVGTDTSAPYAFVWNTTPGSHTVMAKAFDASGNSASSAQLSVQSNPAPAVWFISPEQNAFFTGTFHVVAGASDDAAVTQVQFLVGGGVHATDTTAPYEADLSAPGITTVTARAFDAVGNTSDATLTVRNDTNAPQVAITSPSAYGSVSKTVTYSANAIDDVEVQRVEFYVGGALLDADTSAPYSVPWDTRTQSNGSVTLLARAFDFAGRSTDSSFSVSVFNDAVAPTVALTAPSEGQVVAGSVTVSATASDNVGVASVQFFADGTAFSYDSQAPFAAVWSSTAASNGMHTLTAVASDAQGNTATSSIQVSVDNDVTSPSVAMTSPSAGAVVEGSIPVAADAWDDRGVTKVEFLADGSLFATDTSAPYAATWNTRSSSVNGSKALTARAYDAAGHVATSAAVSVTVNNDWTPPALSISSPTLNAVVSGTVDVAVTATDDRGVARVEFSVNGVLVLTQTQAPFGFAWDTTALPEGNCWLTAVAYDAAGNDALREVIVTVRNDSTPPQVFLTSPTDGASVSGMVTLSADATDNRSVARVEFLVDGALVGTDSTSPFTFAWNSSAVANGAHTVAARAYDQGSLSSTSPAVTVQVANTGPVGEARYDPTLKAPACSVAGPLCASGTLSKGRAQLGPESNAPNTLGSTCADGTAGAYLSDESVESVKVETVDGTTLATGKQVRISVGVYAYSASDYLDIYRAPDASSPIWTLVATVPAPGRGLYTLTATTTLPAGARQAVRASFRYGGTTAVCPSGSYNDRDDLVFAVTP